MAIALIFTCSYLSDNSSKKVEYTVNTGRIVGCNHEFWKALGYDFLFKIVHEPEG